MRFTVDFEYFEYFGSEVLLIPVKDDVVFAAPVEDLAWSTSAVRDGCESLFSNVSPVVAVVLRHFYGFGDNGAAF